MGENMKMKLQESGCSVLNGKIGQWLGCFEQGTEHSNYK
jgi:hypothetical protein